MQGVSGLEVLNQKKIRLYSDDPVTYLYSFHNRRRIDGIARSQAGDIRFLIANIPEGYMPGFLGCTNCPTFCKIDYLNGTDYHAGVFKLASSGNSFEFVSPTDPYTYANQYGSCTQYLTYGPGYFFGTWSTYPYNTLLEGVNKQNGTMAIKAGVIPSGETSLPMPEYFSDTTFSNSRMTATNTALWYVSWGSQQESDDLYPMQNLAIARWQFSTKQWLKTPAANKILQYFATQTSSGCTQWGWCSQVYRIQYVLYSGQEKKFYFLLTAKSSLNQDPDYRMLYRASEDALMLP